MSAMSGSKTKIFVAGHRGLVGSALVRVLGAKDDIELITASRAELDLADGGRVADFLLDHKPAIVIDAAARVGGILDNIEHPADIIKENLLIQTHLIDAAYRAGVNQFVFLGSSCIYPIDAPRPLDPSSWLTGVLEPTNQAYAVAKIAGVEMCRAYAKQYGLRAICVMPTNLYGPGDRFDPQRSHVIPALLHKFACALSAGDDELVLMGSGSAQREFLYADDLAYAVSHLLMSDLPPFDIVNVGYGEELPIADLVERIAQVVGFQGRWRFQSLGPDGTPSKLLNSSRIRSLGWTPKVGLDEGLARTWSWYRDHLGLNV